MEDLLLSILKGAREKLNALGKEFFKPYREVQSPVATLVSCSDSRVQPAVFADTVNRFFVVRNIGNQLLTSLGSVDYGVLELKTPLLLILGHVRCGAVTAAVRSLKPPSEAALAEISTLCPAVKGEESVERAVIKNLLHQERIALERYGALVERNELTVATLLYDFAETYLEGASLFLVSINGREPKGELKKFALPAQD